MLQELEIIKNHHLRVPVKTMCRSQRCFTKHREQINKHRNRKVHYALKEVGFKGCFEGGECRGVSDVFREGLPERRPCLHRSCVWSLWEETVGWHLLN